MANRAARSNARARMATQGWRAKPNQTHASALTAEITATVTPLVAIAFATVVSPAPTAQRSSHAAAVSVSGSHGSGWLLSHLRNRYNTCRDAYTDHIREQRITVRRFSPAGVKHRADIGKKGIKNTPFGVCVVLAHIGHF